MVVVAVALDTKHLLTAAVISLYRPVGKKESEAPRRLGIEMLTN